MNEARLRAPQAACAESENWTVLWPSGSDRVYENDNKRAAALPTFRMSSTIGFSRLGFPRIDHTNGKVFKMSRVPRGQRSFRGEHDPRNHCVAVVLRVPPFLPRGHQFRRLFCGGSVERSDAPLDLFIHQDLKRSG